MGDAYHDEMKNAIRGGPAGQEMESEKAKNMSGKYYLQIGLCSNGVRVLESVSP